MRPALVRASTLTDAAGNNEKARALFAWEQQATRAVVNWLKPTGAGAINTHAGHVSNASGSRTRQSWQALLSLRPPGDARYGADNEYHVSRNPSPNYLCAD